jgi:hypothetical protein
MRSLSETNIFEPVDKLKNIRKVLKETNYDDYIVDLKDYEYLIQVFKGYKYPLAKFVIQAAMKQTIKPILFGEAKDSNKPPIDFPFSFFCIQKGPVVLADISPKAHYVRNTISKEIIQLKMTDRELYAYLQSALIMQVLNKNAERLLMNGKFLKTIAEAYTVFVTRCLDKGYAVTADRAQGQALSYLVAIFFLTYVVRVPIEKAKLIAKTIRIFDMNVITSYFGNLDHVPEMNTIDDFFNTLKATFPYLRSDSLKYRNFDFQFCKMYGQNAVFAIEHLFSFVNMLFMSNMRIGMFNDRMIDDVGSRYVDQLEEIIAEILTTAI